MSSQTPRRVVFRPDAIVAGLFVPGARNLMNEWRDGRVIAVLNRELLLVYLKVLREAGLGPELIRKWILWFTSPEKALYMDGYNSGELEVAKVCDAIAAATDADVVGFSGSSGLS